HRLVGVRLALEDARLGARLDVDLVDEVVRRLLRPIAEVLGAFEVHTLAVARDAHDGAAIRALGRLQRARARVERRIALHCAAAATRAAATAARGDRAAARDLVM